jgi:hypothetical protein
MRDHPRTRRKPLNWRRNCRGRGKFRASCGISAFINTLFRRERRATKPQNAGNCLRFAATRLRFAARLRKLRQSTGHPPQALQPTPIFFAIGSEHLDFAASDTP